ncbi:MAG: S41 family peptidase [Planctomycetota bacterium]
MSLLLRFAVVVVALSLLLPASLASADPPLGYYSDPALRGATLVFVSEGDLWRTTIRGGVATRLTTHAGGESSPVLSPDGRTLAFRASYDGPAEVYTLPIDGGAPTRVTWDASRNIPVGWKSNTELIISTRAHCGLPDDQLVVLDLAAGRRTRIELAQAAQGVFASDGHTLVFTRLSFQGSHTRQYRGGTAQNLWRFDTADTGADAEAVPLTADYDGGSLAPMIWRHANGGDGERIVFASDRSGRMNLWSMQLDGSDLTQHTTHTTFAARNPAIDGSRVVYQHGADIRLLDLATGEDHVVPIRLATDFDQMREKWVGNPMAWLSDAHLSPDGESVVLTSRGEVFIAPRKPGRIVHVTHQPDVRYRDTRFLPDGKRLITLSDESGEVELCTLPAADNGERTQLTSDSEVLRWETRTSPDGRYTVHDDKHHRLFIYDHRAPEGTPANTLLAESDREGFSDFLWSADSRWFACCSSASNSNNVIRLFDVTTKQMHVVTTDRYTNSSPAFSADGKWLFFLSERHLSSSVGSPWGLRAPEPHFDRTTKIYALALQPGLRSPFLPDDEVSRAEAEAEKARKEEEEKRKKEEQQKQKEQENGSQPPPAQPAQPAPAQPQPAQPQPAQPAQPKKDDKPAVPPIEIDFDGLVARLIEVPVEPGNYSNLMVVGKNLIWASYDRNERKRNLMMMAITNDSPEAKVFVPDAGDAELSYDGKRLLVRKGNALHIIPAGSGAPANLKDTAVDLSGWTFAYRPRDEYRQLFSEAWRLERDYFYDRHMHNVDWPAMRARYEPLVARVSNREELNDIIAQMVAELAALHTFVWGGDSRSGSENVASAMLGADIERLANGVWAIMHIYRNDPDEPQRRSPLGEAYQDVRVGDSIEAINGISTSAVPDLGILLRNTIGKQVRLTLRRPSPADAPTRDIIVRPIGPGTAADLRYHEWEYTRRLAVEQAGAGDIGYIHLRAMGSGDIADFVEQYYPVFNRKGLIIDVRHNGGGNIDSWILSRLMRKAWFYWQPRVGKPYWNMHFAFRGHMVVLCDEKTGSDGEAFTEGFRRLGLGKVIGTRTWGGEVWLSMSNRLVDRGIATAGEIGVFADGHWLIEGHGVEPDIVVDNLPHATFNGGDAQIDAAVKHLQQLMKDSPVEDPVPPPYPDKAQVDNRREK